MLNYGVVADIKRIGSPYRIPKLKKSTTRGDDKDARWLKVMTSFNASWISKGLRAQRHHPREEDRVRGLQHPNVDSWEVGNDLSTCSLSPHTWSRLIPGRDSTSLSLPTQTTSPKNNYNDPDDPWWPQNSLLLSQKPPPCCIYSKYAILCYHVHTVFDKQTFAFALCADSFACSS